MKEAATNKGFTVWFTGLPCSGKTTLANLLAAELQKRGRGVEILDGDVVRTHLSKGLGFSREDRDENIRRIGYVCGLLSKHGAIAIAAAVSPFRATRDQLRGSIGNFVEVYVSAPLEVCMARDVKGMYKKAIAGEIAQFTGISDPYEHPLNPELTVEAYQEPPEASAARIVGKLEQMGLVEPAGGHAYTQEEGEKIRARLVDLGYIEP
jgi:adenylyl-sulfate kinase